MGSTKISASLAAYFLAISTGIVMVIIPNQYEAINYNGTITAVVLTRTNLVVAIISFIFLILGHVFFIINMRSADRIKALFIAIIIPYIFFIWYALIPLPPV